MVTQNLRLLRCRWTIIDERSSNHDKTQQSFNFTKCSATWRKKPYKSWEAIKAQSNLTNTGECCDMVWRDVRRIRDYCYFLNQRRTQEEYTGWSFHMNKKRPLEDFAPNQEWTDSEDEDEQLSDQQDEQDELKKDLFMSDDELGMLLSLYLSFISTSRRWSEARCRER